MIYSMTAYARHELQNDSAIVCWDIRSVNNRYLDVSIKLPEELRSLEFSFREVIKKNIRRGKLDCTLKVNNVLNTDSSAIKINMALAKQIIMSCQEIASNMQTSATISPLEILQWPNIIESDNTLLENIERLAKDSLMRAIVKLNEHKQKEGIELSNIILNKLNSIEEHINAIKQFLPNTIEKYQEKLLDKLQSLTVTYDPSRLEQELLYLAQKTDIAEEVDRLNIHINEAKNILNKEEMVGRRLDFLMQEVNREVNTLSAKSIDPKISSIVVELKILIEQIREQAQNLE